MIDHPITIFVILEENTLNFNFLFSYADYESLMEDKLHEDKERFYSAAVYYLVTIYRGNIIPPT